MKKKFYISHFILCLFLICFGAASGYFILSSLFFEIHAISYIGLILMIPTLILICVLPLYGGISYLISIIKGEDSEMYPTNTEEKN